MVPRTKSLLQIPTKLNECFPIHSTFCCQPQYSQIFPLFLPYKVSWALGKGHTSVVGSEKSQLGSFPLKRTPPDICTRRSGLVQHFPSEHLEFNGVAINQRIGGVWRNGVRSQALVSYPRGRRFKPKPVRLTFFSVCVCMEVVCTQIVHQQLQVVQVSRQNIWVSSVQNRRQMGKAEQSNLKSAHIVTTRAQGKTRSSAQKLLRKIAGDFHFRSSISIWNMLTFPYQHRSVTKEKLVWSSSKRDDCQRKVEVAEILDHITPGSDGHQETSYGKSPDECLAEFVI